MQKQWLFEGGFEYDAVSSLQQEVNISESLATLLVQRGVRNKEDAKSYFKPQISDLHDPFQ